MRTVYFIAIFHFTECIYFTIEYVGGNEGFVEEKGKINHFKTVDDLKVYCDENSIPCNYDMDSSLEYEVEKLDVWLEEMNGKIDADFILDVWNMMDDVASSIEEKFLGDDHSFDDVYDKLVYAFDPLLFEESKKSVLSKFSDENLEEIRRVMKSGRNIIDKAFSRD